MAQQKIHTPSWLTRFVIAPLVYLRSWFVDLSSILSPCRFSVLMVLIVSVMLCAVPQCQEAVRALAERNEVSWLVVAQWTTFFVAAMLLAFNAWYWARQMLNVGTATRVEMTLRRDQMRRYVPRVAGTGALLMITVALWLSGRAYHLGESAEADAAYQSLNKAIWVSATLTAAFHLFVVFRRRLFGLDWNTPVNSVRDLSPVTRWLMLGSAALAFVLFLCFCIVPLPVGAFLGAPSIVLLAAATWIPFGSACVFFGLRHGFPALTLMFCAAVIFGWWNDNHQVHVLTDPKSFAAQLPPPASRRTIDDAAHAWLQARQTELLVARGSQHKYPVFVVAAAGGGIRAAYWTATLLAGLEDKFPARFSHHTFGISGVSGGSVGSAAFVALLAEQQAGRISYRMGNHPECDGMLRPWACAMLSQDFLSPVTGSMLYTDLTQRFLPWSVKSFDRGRTLERSFEEAWRSQGLQGDRMSEPFAALWSDDTGSQLPLLFLNSTTVESGRRAIAAPVRLGDGRFHDAMDVMDEIGKPIPLSTAAHLSARFTYLSPAGTVVDEQGKAKLHLVDGGYFENDGLSTAEEIAESILRAAQDQQLGNAICLKVLVISNSQGYIADGKSYDGAPMKLLTELRAPIAAVFNARDARSRYAEAVVRERSQAVLFGLQQRQFRAQLPLGWMLSDVAQHEIDQQVVDTLASGANTASLATLLTGASQCD